jgi:hypothetical protein
LHFIFEEISFRFELKKGEILIFYAVDGLKELNKSIFCETGMTKERDAGQKFPFLPLTVLNKIMSSLSMTQHIFEFLHRNSERNHKLIRIAIQKEVRTTSAPQLHL